MEGKFNIKGTNLVTEDTVGGSTYMCDEHFEEWENLKLITFNENGDFNTEAEYNKY